MGFETFREFRGCQGSSCRRDFNGRIGFGHPDATKSVESSRGSWTLRTDMLFLFVLFAGLEVADAHLAPILQLADGLAEIVLVFQVCGKVFEVLMIHHAGEGFGFIVEVTLLFGAFFVSVVVLAILKQFVFENDLLSICTPCETGIVNIHDKHFQFHFRFEFTSPWVDTVARIEHHVLNRFFSFIAELGFELESAGHVALYFMTSGDGSGGLLLWCCGCG